MQSSYITSAQEAHQIPEFASEEIAFFGRSNSGKSTLLNALLGRKNLARSSATPGRTQMINFFKVELSKGSELIFADFPGFGYSKAAKKIEKNWSPLVDKYVSRPNVRCFLFLMDIRRDITEVEVSYIDYLSRMRPTHIILTKADKIKQSELAKKKREFKRDFGFDGKIFVVSCLKNTGIEELRQEVLVPSETAASQ